MKAKIISQKVYEGVIGRVHGCGSTVRRLVVEEADNLAVTPHNDQVYACTGFDSTSDGTKLLGEVEVPDELVEKALAFVRAKAEFDGLKGKFEELLG